MPSIINCNALSPLVFAGSKQLDPDQFNDKKKKTIISDLFKFYLLSDLNMSLVLGWLLMEKRNKRKSAIKYAARSRIHLLSL